MRYLILPAAFLALAACSEDFSLKPSYFASGYKYHGDEFKAPPGPDAPDIGYDYNLIDNQGVVENWMAIAADLVDQFEQDTQTSPQAIYIEPLRDSNAFNAAYNYALHETFRQKGYTLVGAPVDQGLHIRYEAYRPQDAELRNKVYYNDESDNFLTPHNPERAYDFTFVLTAARNDQFIGQSYVQRPMPAYGYVADEGQHAIEERIRKDAPDKSDGPPIMDFYNP